MQWHAFKGVALPRKGYQSRLHQMTAKLVSILRYPALTQSDRLSTFPSPHHVDPQLRLIKVHSRSLGMSLVSVGARVCMTQVLLF